ncbi:hypothetical protein CTAYLR_006848 [Chrysophaeum taylorii]|uniref:Hflx-type G domain-containing protein n=1 Tax=Chrysophaeum taylorii TaxID=2483200 RepID=A0AAD7U577_9STRA|nr:hypothetical protein CTAYLR_006848 [Chrysophaeum taylorii]
MGLEGRLRLRGVAAAESAYAAAELAAAAAAMEDEFLVSSPFAHLDASEAKAAALALNTSAWPSAYLVGIDVTSRRGAAKLAEQRRRGFSSVLEAASSAADWAVGDSLEELERLCETARLRVAGSTFQRLERANGATMVGKGKLAEVAELVAATGADAVVFDDELTLAQQRNVMAELAEKGCPASLQVLDRTQLVLQIFSERARTREAKTQVALARAEYMLPRLATFMTTGAGMELRGGSGGGGGGGGAYLRGAGETQLEMDRRLYGKRIQRLKKSLDDVAAKRRAIRDRKLARADELPLVALVGYTNAGKTSLLNALSDAAEPLYADDKLFATLDPTTRRVALPAGRACKLADTVGFLQKLPTRLIASFRATLEEISDATLIIHVVDASSTLAKNHVDSVNAILDELAPPDAPRIPQIRVLNKLDRLVSDDDDDEDLATAALEIGARVVARTSATRGDGIDELLRQIDNELSAMNAPVHCLVPFTQGHLLSEIYQTGTVVDLEHLDTGTRIKARVPQALCSKLAKFALEKHSDDDDDDDDDDDAPLLATRQQDQLLRSGQNEEEEEEEADEVATPQSTF